MKRPLSLPVVAINLRLKQMRKLAQRRNARGMLLDAGEWTMIYAEGLARRYGGRALKTVMHRDTVASGLRPDDDEIDQATVAAEMSFAVASEGSAYTTDMIGKRLGITLKERKEFAYHLGCGEETKEERKTRMKAEKKVRDAKRASGKISREKLKPWLAEGMSRATWYARTREEKLAGMTWDEQEAAAINLH
jgi:hypothetical protein